MFLIDGQTGKKRIRGYLMFFSDMEKNESLPPKLESVTFLSSYDFLPLQAADMVAWEEYQHGLDLLKNKHLKRPRRRQLSRLTKGGRIALGMAAPDTIKRIATRLKNVDPERMLAVADHMTV